MGPSLPFCLSCWVVSRLDATKRFQTRSLSFSKSLSSFLSGCLPHTHSLSLSFSHLLNISLSLSCILYLSPPLSLSYPPHYNSLSQVQHTNRSYILKAHYLYLSLSLSLFTYMPRYIRPFVRSAFSSILLWSHLGSIRHLFGDHSLSSRLPLSLSLNKTHYLSHRNVFFDLPSFKNPPLRSLSLHFWMSCMSVGISPTKIGFPGAVAWRSW